MNKNTRSLFSFKIHGIVFIFFFYFDITAFLRLLAERIKMTKKDVLYVCDILCHYNIKWWKILKTRKINNEHLWIRGNHGTDTRLLQLHKSGAARKKKHERFLLRSISLQSSSFKHGCIVISLHTDTQLTQRTQLTHHTSVHSIKKTHVFSLHSRTRFVINIRVSDVRIILFRIIKNRSAYTSR